MHNQVEFLILGGGLTGLLLGQELQKRQRSFLILEKSSRLGGRIGSEAVNGFTLDLGFQVSLDSYDWINQWGDSLDLAWHEFDSGAFVHSLDLNHPLYNPIWHLKDCLKNLQPLPQKALFAKAVLPIFWTSPQSVAHLTTADYLKQLEVPSAWIEMFFKPFFGGVFLDRELKTQASLFIYLFKKFSLGKAIYPQGGFQNLIKHLSRKILQDQILVNQEVIKIQESSVLTAQGQNYQFTKLIQTYPDQNEPIDYQATHTLWYRAPKSKSHQPQRLLHLNGYADQPIAHACILTDIAPELAPEGYHLITASVTSPASYFKYQESEINQTLSRWFKPLGIKQLELLKTHSIPKALPTLKTMKLFNPSYYVKKSNQHFLVGDHWSIPSQEGVGQAVNNFIKNEVDI